MSTHIVKIGAKYYRVRANTLSELSNLATLIFFSLVFFNFLAHATQNIGLSSVRTLAYTFQTNKTFLYAMVVNLDSLRVGVDGSICWKNCNPIDEAA